MRTLHRLALLAYPAAFRQEFGGELQRIFEERWREARARSGAHALITGLYAVVDALGSGISERLAERPQRPRTSRSLTMTRDSVRQDIGLTLRQFRRAPLFAALTIASLALGIGANTAMFAVLHAVLLQPLPYSDPDALVMIWSDNTNNREPANPVSPANFEAFREAPSLERVEGMYAFLTPFQIRAGGEPEPVLVSQVTPGMLSLLGRAPIAGRTFDEQGTPQGAVLSYRFWQRRFGGDPGVIGRTILVGGAGSTEQLPIIGVMPQEFTFPYGSMLGRSGFTRSTGVDMWWPISRTRDPRLVDATGQPNRSIHYFSVIGRLAPGAGVERARADLAAIASRRALQFADTNAGWGVTVRPLHEQTVGSIRPALLILLGGVCVVLLMTCINVANVLLARAAGRGRDRAIRSALGASRVRLIQQMLTESTLLALAGGVAGLGVMALVLRGTLLVAPSYLPRITEISPGWPVVAFAGAVSLLAGMAVGVLPAISAARSQAQDALRQGTRTTASRPQQRTRAALIVSQVALATTLAIAAGLLLRSFVAVVNVDPGFNPQNLLTMQLAVPSRYSTPASILTFYDELEAKLRALPGVNAVGGTTRLPLGSTSVTAQLEVDGRPVPRANLPEVEMRRALFDYFAAMEIPVTRGRTFTRDDHIDAPRAAVINETLAERLFAEEDPVGKRVRFATSPGAWMTIVGVVGDIRHGSLEEIPRPEVYITYRQGPPVGPFVVLRATSNPSRLAGSVRQVVRDMGADPPADIQTMDVLRSGSVAARRFVLLLVGAFGALALVLAALGVFGVVTLMAAERTTEVGIRLALGATPSQVLSLMVGQAARLAGAGIALGVAGALMIRPVVQAQLFGVTATDPLTYAGVCSVLAVTALLAAYAPARRAMKVDPATALRVQAG